jgi:hypothetical protein
MFNRFHRHLSFVQVRALLVALSIASMALGALSLPAGSNWG